MDHGDEYLFRKERMIINFIKNAYLAGGEREYDDIYDPHKRIPTRVYRVHTHNQGDEKKKNSAPPAT